MGFEVELGQNRTDKMFGMTYMGVIDIRRE